MISENTIRIKLNEPQLDFITAQEYELLYGGSAGGGKTFILVVEPMQYIHVPNFTAILFRRNYPELMGSIFPLTQEYYVQAGAVWNEQKKTYTFPSGATIRLGYMEHGEDWRKYQGHEYGAHLFDELTNFTDDQYRKIAVWNRSRAEGIKAYRRSASNPGGVGHLWVKSYFVDTCPPEPKGEKIYSSLARMWWQPVKSGRTYYRKVYSPDGEDRYITSKFIPSRVFDNEELLRKNPNYLVQLLQQDERQRRAMLEGDWNAFEGQFFTFNTETQYIDPFVIPSGWRIIAGLDAGYSSPTSFSVSAIDFEGNIYRVASYYEKNRSPKEHAEGINKFLEGKVVSSLLRGRRPDAIIADPSCWSKKDRFAIVTSDKSFADVMADNGLYLERGLNDRIQGWWAMKDLMGRKNDDGTPKYYVFKNLNTDFIDELSSAVADEKRPEDIEGIGNNPNVSDHALDEERYKLMAIYKPIDIKKPELPDWALMKLAKQKKKATKQLSVMSK